MLPIHYVRRHINGDIIAYDQTDQIVSKLTESGLLRVWELYPNVKVLVPPPKSSARFITSVMLMATAPLVVQKLPQKLDNTVLQNNDRILLIGQKNPKKNGIVRVSTYSGENRGMMMPLPEAPFQVKVTKGLVKGGSVWLWDGKDWTVQTP